MQYTFSHTVLDTATHTMLHAAIYTMLQTAFPRTQHSSI